MPESHGKSATTSFRAVERTLAVIRALNKRNGATVAQLTRMTRIPRPSLYRILGSLCELGYLHRTDEGGGRYQLTLLVRALSDGFEDEDWMYTIAQPIMASLQAEIVWPTDISTFFDNAMHLRGTTRGSSPLTIDTARPGLRLPMLQSAAGRAYLAFCGDAEREAILLKLRSSSAPGDRLARDRNLVRNILIRTRKKGFGERHKELFEKTGAIAIPIRRKHHLLGCLSISFIASALTPDEAASRYLPQLNEAARAIERGCAA
jgi:IclR family mhp operon transcriptional activator